MAEAVRLGPHATGDRRSLVTPEGIDLSLGLATGGQRVGAFLLDLMIMLLALVILSVAAFWIAGAALSSGSTLALELIGAIWLVGWFVIRNGYFILAESGRRAATKSATAVTKPKIAQRTSACMSGFCAGSKGRKTS